jgi:hypothetical protein
MKNHLLKIDQGDPLLIELADKTPLTRFTNVVLKRLIAGVPGNVDPMTLWQYEALEPALLAAAADLGLTVQRVAVRDMRGYLYFDSEGAVKWRWLRDPIK